MIEWTEKYTTGVDDIDNQHKIMFRIINELEQQVRQEADSETVRKAIEALENYVAEHFGFEELCMDSLKCPKTEENKNAHRRFVKDLKIFKVRFETGDQQLDILKEINSFAKEWLNHILNIDSHLKHCVKHD